MGDNEKYSEKAWELISVIPQLTGLLMSTASFSGIEGTKNELKAAVNTIAEGKVRFPDNKLILSVIPGRSFEEALKKVKKQQKDIISSYRIDDRYDLNWFQNSIIKKYSEVMHYINKTEMAQTVNEFKLWLLEIAEQVAIAAIENTVFGKETNPFSEKEKDIFNKIKKALTELT